MTISQTAPAPAAAPLAAAPPRWRRLTRKPTFLVGAAILLFWVVCAIAGSSIASDSPLAQSLLATNAAPSAAHWFGTDQLGRDVLSRVLVGSRDILIITPLATVLGTVCGTALGLAMGYFGGVLDAVASRPCWRCPRSWSPSCSSWRSALRS
jgi:peptide/nickel transport system permease protein